MANGTDKSQGTHGHAAPVILLATLLAVTAAAWWVTQTRGKPQRVAKRILDDLRAGGLSRTWPQEEHRLLFVVKDARGKPVGWRVYLRGRTENGYAGRTIDRFAPAFASARWTLSESASQGEYHSQYVPPEGGSTVVTLQQGRITIAESRGPIGHRATAEAPDNYIPEGMRSAVMWEVARRSEEAAFVMTKDGESFADGQVHFVAITMAPQGPRKVRLGQVAIYEFDDAGDILRIEHSTSGVEYARVDAEELVKAFPETRSLLVKTDEPSEGTTDDTSPAQ